MIPEIPKNKRFMNMSSPKPFLMLRKSLLVFMTLSIFSCGNTNVDTQQLFTDSFEPAEMVLPERGLTDPSKDTQLYNQARAEYGGGEYAAASASFEKLSEDEPRSLAYIYFHGMSLLASGQASASIPVFEKILTAPRVSLVIQQARWYLAMAYFKTNNTAKAKEMLQGIEEGQFNFAEAKILLGKL